MRVHGSADRITLGTEYEIKNIGKVCKMKSDPVICRA